MTETKFTPAPWFAEQNSVWVDNDKLVCSCYKFDTKTADSNLIAAAPELYEALIDVLDSWAEDYRFGEDNNVCERANKALAKARGEV